MRPLLDRLLAWVAFLALRGFFRSIEVLGRERVPRERPLLVVANHYNAMVDAALVVHVLGRVPRFLAKSTLWRSWLIRPVLAIPGLVPVYRRQDAPKSGQDQQENQGAFEATYRVLGRRGSVALFPEGMVSKTPTLAPLRTGAARIALGAGHRGARGLCIVPIGLFYEDRVALRSRALARVGEPIDLDAEAGAIVGGSEAADEDDHAAVRRLTELITARMRAVVPGYRDEREASVLGRAAEIALRRASPAPAPKVTLARREELGERLARASPEVRTRLLDALARYHLDLSLLGLRDEQLAAGYRAPQLLRLLLSTVLRLVALAPFALVGAVINALPYWAVRWAGRVINNPEMKATGRLLVGVVLFPLAWLAAVWAVPWEGWLARAGVFAASPALGLVAVRALERAVAVERAWHGWVALKERSGSLGQVREDRERLCRLVAEASEGAMPGAGTWSSTAPADGADTPDRRPAPSERSSRSSDC